jgi:hypothetical protein
MIPFREGASYACLLNGAVSPLFYVGSVSRMQFHDQPSARGSNFVTVEVGHRFTSIEGIEHEIVENDVLWTWSDHDSVLVATGALGIDIIPAQRYWLFGPRLWRVTETQWHRFRSTFAFTQRVLDAAAGPRLRRRLPWEEPQWELDAHGMVRLAKLINPRTSWDA